mmetsp:Transcript_20393/g.70660  ORF Transcript_20393/g.70660 Transcript_20393/m.70660 type:complete len:224 (-) Transcript_20393:152-823(-)
MAPRSTSRVLLATAAGGMMLFACRPSAFTEPSVVQRQLPEAVSRSAALRRLWLGAAAASPSLVGAAPSFGLSGVTAPWGTDPNGGEDTLHTGGVEWEDVKVGTGSTPKIGDLVAIQFTCTANIRERELTIDDTNGKARDYRFGVGQMLAGMDEGLLGMRTGGQRRLKIPGKLAFGSKAVPAGTGRPSIPAYTPVEVLVSLDFIPGSDEVYSFGKADEELIDRS